MYESRNACKRYTSRCERRRTRSASAVQRCTCTSDRQRLHTKSREKRTRSTRKPHPDHTWKERFPRGSFRANRDIVGRTVESTTGRAVDRIWDEQQLTFLVRSSRMHARKSHRNNNSPSLLVPCGIPEQLQRLPCESPSLFCPSLSASPVVCRWSKKV